MKKRLLALVLALAMTLSLTVVGASAKTVKVRGTCGSFQSEDDDYIYYGNNVTWTLYTDGSLVFSGSGSMCDFAAHKVYNPWDDYASSVKSIVVNEGITEIPSYMAYDFTNLTSVSLPSTVACINTAAFAKCSALTSVSLASGVTDIDACAFAECESLTSITLPSTVTYIGAEAFSECSGLTSVKLSSGLMEIGDGAFMDCTALTSVTIPSKVESMNQCAFLSCTALKSVTFDNCPVEIGYSAFLGCTALSSVTLSSRCTSIGEAAFGGCTALKSITIPASVASISEKAFGKAGLTSITLLGSPSIADDAFYGVAGASGRYNSAYWSEDRLSGFGGEITWFSNVYGFNDVYTNNWFSRYVGDAVDMGLMSGTSSTTFDPYGKTSRAMVVQILYAMENKPSVSGMENPFTDVGKAWYHDAVVWAYNNSVTSGTSATTFSPNQDITRQEIAVLLWAYAGRPSVSGNLSAFADEGKVSSWARTALIWANQNGIINGSQDGSTLNLNPKNTATRAETATMMVAFNSLY